MARALKRARVAARVGAAGEKAAVDIGAHIAQLPHAA